MVIMKLKWLQLLLCASFLLPVSSSFAKKDKTVMNVIKGQFDSISGLLEKADKKREKGDIEEARQLYGATIVAYQDFNEKFPHANTEIVKFRIAYCRNQLINLLADKQEIAAKKEKAEKAGKSAGMSSAESKIIAENIELCRIGKYKKVYSNMRKFIKKHPDCSKAYLLKGTAEIAEGRDADAIKSLKKVLELDPADRDAHYNISQLLIRAELPDFNSAAIHYKRAVQLGADEDSDLKSVLDL
jgi:tetratricopeptide (TPR) repeat protein